MPFLTGGPSACSPAALLGGGPKCPPFSLGGPLQPSPGAQEPGGRRAGLGSVGTILARARPLLRVWPPHLQACAYTCAPAWHAVPHAGQPAPGLCPSGPAWVSWAGSGARARPSPGPGSWFLVGDHLAGKGLCQCPRAPVPLTGLELTWLEGGVDPRGGTGKWVQGTEANSAPPPGSLHANRLSHLLLQCQLLSFPRGPSAPTDRPLTLSPRQDGKPGKVGDLGQEVPCCRERLIEFLPGMRPAPPSFLAERLPSGLIRGSEACGRESRGWPSSQPPWSTPSWVHVDASAGQPGIYSCRPQIPPGCPAPGPPLKHQLVWEVAPPPPPCRTMCPPPAQLLLRKIHTAPCVTVLSSPTQASWPSGASGCA